MTRNVIEADGAIAPRPTGPALIHEGFFDDPISGGVVQKELAQRSAPNPATSTGNWTTWRDGLSTSPARIPSPSSEEIPGGEGHESQHREEVREVMTHLSVPIELVERILKSSRTLMHASDLANFQVSSKKVRKFKAKLCGSGRAFDQFLEQDKLDQEEGNRSPERTGLSDGLHCQRLSP